MLLTVANVIVRTGTTLWNYDPYMTRSIYNPQRLGGGGDSFLIQHSEVEQVVFI